MMKLTDFSPSFIKPALRQYLPGYYFAAPEVIIPCIPHLFNRPGINNNLFQIG